MDTHSKAAVKPSGKPIGKPLGKLLITPFTGVIIVLLSLFFISSGNDELTQVEQIQARGYLTMITRNGATSWYLGRDGDTGFEYDLVKGFADSLGVKLKIRPAARFQDMFPMLKAEAGDLIAANVSRTPEREKYLNFGPDYELVDSVVVYRRGYKKPRKLADLIGNRIRVIAGSSHEAELHKAQQDLPQLRWQSNNDNSAEDLFTAVAEGIIDYAIVDSLVFDINQRYFPLVRKGFNLGQARPLAWVLQAGDKSLELASEAYFVGLKQNQQLSQFKLKYFQQSDKLGHVGMYTFMAQLKKRLPAVLPIFLEVAHTHNLEWELLAAMGYQESHWDPDAVSFTGVRGIMMLTRQTALHLGVADREDPTQSIEGGARYINELLGKVPARIPMPDRLWMALAAYNLGYGHLEDARRLTQSQGGNPDSWADVEDTLPLLSQEKWYSKTRYGYSRGYEAVKYVNNIREYAETLRWMQDRNHPALDTAENERMDT
ncbi:MAG: membrane-bound lytic murein transglycosylase MltF [Xanthomonadales bacterium]|nr:membrane-bound lytic murein transglycosylase MltF [Xanthomonadales bacterium]